MSLITYILDTVTRKRMAYPFLPRLDGFEDPFFTSISYDYTQRTMTFTHPSGTVAVWHKGLRYAFTSPYTSNPHSSNNGEYYLSIISTGNVSWSVVPFDLSIRTPMAFAHYDSSHGVYFGIRECHGLMDWEVHQELHDKIGTYRRSDGLLTAGSYVVGAGGDSDTNVSPGTDQVELADEDCPTINQVYVKGSYTRLYFSSGSPMFSTGNALPFPTFNTTIEYNPTATSLAVLPGNNTYVNLYALYLPVTLDVESQKYRTVWMIGQSTYTSLTAAQSEDIRTLNFGNLTSIITEFVPSVQITYRHNTGYGGAGRTRIEAAPVYLSGSKASLIGVTGVTPAVHNNLTGRQDVDCHPGTSISLTALNTQTYTDVGSSIQHLYDRYPGFHDYIETVATTTKSIFTLDIAIAADHVIDIYTDGRNQAIEGTHWSRTVGSPGIITLSETINQGSVFKARVYTK